MEQKSLSDSLMEPLSAPPKTAWRGVWVWTSAEGTERNTYGYFRRAFSTTGGKLAIDISADSFYWLYLDGEFIGRGPSRAPLNYYSLR